MNEKTKQLTVKKIMQKEVHTVYPNQTIFDAAVLMASKNIGTLPVIKEDGVLVGILTDRDIVIRCTAIGKEPKRTKIYECMSTNPIRTVPSATASDAIMLMSEYGVRRVPIVENDRLVGIVSISDLAKTAKPPTERCINDGTSEVCDFVRLARELEKTSHCEHSCGSCDI
ncbi:MAG: CBS domain-containing protein [Candidatus Melainabacteria bacterium]|nr:CBS domain-containing protein [Candidatus Melainabacteria bacterium]